MVWNKRTNKEHLHISMSHYLNTWPCLMWTYFTGRYMYNRKNERHNSCWSRHTASRLNTGPDSVSWQPHTAVTHFSLPGCTAVSSGSQQCVWLMSFKFWSAAVRLLFLGNKLQRSFSFSHDVDSTHEPQAGQITLMVRSANAHSVVLARTAPTANIHCMFQNQEHVFFTVRFL